MVKFYERILLNAPFWIKSVRSYLAVTDLADLSETIKEAEKRSNGEILLLVEGAFNLSQLISGISPSERAKELFVLEKVWDTDNNSGVLIYILLSEHAVEIVADRGFTAVVSQAELTAICRNSADTIRNAGLAKGIKDAVNKISGLQTRMNLKDSSGTNQLSDAVRVIR